jgi:hypothetical protein
LCYSSYILFTARFYFPFPLLSCMILKELFLFLFLFSTMVSKARSSGREVEFFLSLYFVLSYQSNKSSLIFLLHVRIHSSGYFFLSFPFFFFPTVYLPISGCFASEFGWFLFFFLLCIISLASGKVMPSPFFIDIFFTAGASRINNSLTRDSFSLSKFTVLSAFSSILGYVVCLATCSIVGFKVIKGIK